MPGAPGLKPGDWLAERLPNEERTAPAGCKEILDKLMPSILRDWELVTEIVAQEEQLHATQFIAPCVRGGRVRTRVAGLVCTFRPEPRDFDGWAIFQPVSADT